MHTVIPKFDFASELNGPAYYRTCPTILAKRECENMTFKYNHYSTQSEPWEQLQSVRNLTDHSLFFVLEGEIHIYWDGYKNIVFKAGEMFFLPRGAVVSGYIVGDVSYVVSSIKRGMTSKELDDLRNMKRYERFENFEFKPLPMHPPMQRLAESIRDFLVSGVNCPHLHEAKSAELYVILHWYYSISDNAELFYPMAGAISEFKNFILDNFQITTSIDDLVKKANMSRSTFDRKFKETFSTIPLKWIDEQTRQAIIGKAAEPNVSVKDMMYEVGVYNPSQFTKLCKRLCGVIPTDLIKTK